MAYGASLLVIDLFRLLFGNESGSISAIEQKPIELLSSRLSSLNISANGLRRHITIISRGPIRLGISPVHHVLVVGYKLFGF